MSKSVICLGERVSLLAPLLPRVVMIRPAFESFERAFLTKVGSALTLSASIAEGISSPSRKPRAAMMCAATVNWTLVADIGSPTAYVMLTSTIRIQVFLTGLPGCAVVLDWHQMDWNLFNAAGRNGGQRFGNSCRLRV